MARKLKIKVVVGVLSDPALLQFWESIANIHSVELFALESGASKFKTSLPCMIFPQISDMPGFFRDLDKYLHGADLIVGIESSKLYSFQALRAARKLGIKFACIIHEYSPFLYERYQNIRAIQHDIYNHSDVLIPTSRRAAQLLQIEGVSATKILRITTPADIMQFRFDEGLRDRFKKYIRIPEDSRLVTIKTSLVETEPALTLIQGVRLALSQIDQELRAKVRILICGDGEGATKLKYEVSDMGLGSQTMFLAQDTDPFLVDLLSATDVLLEGKFTRAIEPDPLPWHVLGAACCGASIVVSAGSVADDWLSGITTQRVEDFSAMDLAFALSGVLKQPLDSGFMVRTQMSKAAIELLSPDRVAANFMTDIERLCEHDERLHRRDGLISFIKRHQFPISYRDASDVLIKCEELREFAATCDNADHSELLRIRGDALVAMSRGDEALLAFEQSLKFNQGNFHALRGLGYLAWHGHSNEDALSFFRRGLAAMPADYQCLVGIGLVYRRLKMFTESVYWLQKAVAVGGPESPSLSLLVQACLENPDAPESLQTLSALRDSIGDHPNLMTAIGKLESHL